MKIIGIICEYNPLHNGHIYQINKIKEMYPDSLLIVITSSSFTQRGDISILNKFDKTLCALNSNIDLVLELPYIYTVQSADIFAKYALSILNTLHIDTLCFGTERDTIDDLINIASVQINNNEYNIKVKEYLNEGNNYPTSLNKALVDLGYNSVEEPNDLLALSYIKEIIKNSYKITPFNIKRTNSYHDIESNLEIVSSSNIRNKILNNIDYSNEVPSYVYNILKNKKINNKYFELLKYKINSETNLSKYLDVNEGIDIRIKKYINESNNLEELINNIKTKRFTYNKINRILNHILCSYTKEEFIKNVEYIRILGFNSRGKDYLNSIKKDINIPILNSYNTNYKGLEVEQRVTNIYSQIYEDINKKERSNKPIIV